MKNLLEFILVHLVTHPESVEVTETAGFNGPVFQLKVHDEDIGRVIGKQGKIIKAIRKIAQVKAVKEGIFVQILLDQDSALDSAPALAAAVSAPAPSATTQTESEVDSEITES